jgi:hypothetical protein
MLGAHRPPARGLRTSNSKRPAVAVGVVSLQVREALPPAFVSFELAGHALLPGAAC